MNWTAAAAAAGNGALPPQPRSAWPNNPGPNQAPPARPTPNDGMWGYAALGQAAPGQAPSNQAAPGYAAPNQGAPGYAAPSQGVPLYEGAGQAGPGYAAPHQAEPGYAAPGYAAPNQAGPGYTAPHQPAPGYAVPGQAGPSEAGPGYRTPGQPGPGQPGPAQPGQNPAGPARGWQQRGASTSAPGMPVAGPSRTRPLPLQRSGAGWAMLGLLGLGLVLLVCGLVMLGDSLTVIPTSPYALATAAVLFGAHGLVLYLVVRWLDFPVRRAVWLMALSVAWGGLVSTSLSLTVETWLGGLLSLFGPSPSAGLFLGATLVSVTEESAKLLGVLAIVLLAPRRLSRAADGLVYGALVGLGFEEIENIIYAVKATNTAGAGLGASILPVIVLFLQRGLVAGWGLHIVWSALTGAGIAWAYLNRDRPKGARIGVAALAFAVAGVCHMLWDSALADWIVALGPMFMVMIVVAPLVLIIVVAGRGQAAFAVKRLAQCADPAVATPAELIALSSPYRRFGAMWHGYVRGGFGLARVVGRLQRGQATLAMVLLSGDAAAGAVPGGPGNAGPGNAGPGNAGGVRSDELSAAHTEVQTARRELSAAGLPEAAGPDLYQGSPVIGWVGLATGFLGLVGMQVLFGLTAGAWGAGSLLLVAFLVTGLGSTALVLCAREVRKARAGRVPADARLGVATLPGILSVLLGLILFTALIGLLALAA